MAVVTKICGNCGQTYRYDPTKKTPCPYCNSHKPRNP